MRSCVSFPLLQGGAGETLERTAYYIRFLTVSHLQGGHTASTAGGHPGAHQWTQAGCETQSDHAVRLNKTTSECILTPEAIYFI